MCQAQTNSWIVELVVFAVQDYTMLPTSLFKANNTQELIIANIYIVDSGNILFYQMYFPGGNKL